jgi:hypothetical protein
MLSPFGSPPRDSGQQLVGRMTTETSFAHVVRAHGMRLFYSRLMFLDPRGVTWTSWVMAVGRESTNPQFCHAFLYTDTDPRELLKFAAFVKQHGEPKWFDRPESR